MQKLALDRERAFFLPFIPPIMKQKLLLIPSSIYLVFLLAKWWLEIKAKKFRLSTGRYFQSGIGLAVYNTFFVVRLVLIWFLSLVVPVRYVIVAFTFNAIRYELGDGPHSDYDWMQVLVVLASVWFLISAYAPF